MKKISIFISMLLLTIAGKAQISDTLQLSLNELQFQAVDSFTQVSFPSCSFGNDAGVPQIPFWVVRYVIPYDQKVDTIITDNLSSLN